MKTLSLLLLIILISCSQKDKSGIKTEKQAIDSIERISLQQKRENILPTGVSIADFEKKDSIISYESANKTVSLDFTFSVIIGLKDTQKQDRINEYLRSSVLYPDTTIQNTLEKESFDPRSLREEIENGSSPVNYLSVWGEIHLLTDDFLCYEVGHSYDYWGAAHGSTSSRFMNLDLRTFQEAPFNKFFNAKAEQVFCQSRGYTPQDSCKDIFPAIVSLGISTHCECESCFCIQYFFEGDADGHGYTRNEIPLSDFSGALNEKEILSRLLDNNTKK